MYACHCYKVIFDLVKFHEMVVEHIAKYSYGYSLTMSCFASANQFHNILASSSRKYTMGMVCQQSNNKQPYHTSVTQHLSYRNEVISYTRCVAQGQTDDIIFQCGLEGGGVGQVVRCGKC